MLDAQDIAHVAYEAIRAYCLAIGDHSQMPWKDADQWQRDSSISGTEAVLHDPSITPGALHAKWVECRLSEGWRWGPEKDPDRKRHPCLVPYAHLPVAQRAKDYIFHSIVRSLAPHWEGRNK